MYCRILGKHKKSLQRKKSHTSAPGSPAVVAPAVNTNREENMSGLSRISIDDDHKSDCAVLKARDHNILKVGTWNVRTLAQDGKVENLMKEAKDLKIDILGISETRLIDTGEYNNDDTYTLFNSGGDQRMHGVGLLVRKHIAKSIQGIICVSKRNILIKIKGAPFDMSILQTYAPTLDHSDEEIEEYYDEVAKTLKTVKSDEILIVMGDMNAKIGKGKSGSTVGEHGLGKRNERGERLINFCNEMNLCIANTFFEHPARKLYTWKSPGDVHRNQIDFIMIRKRFRNSLKQCSTYPGADIDSDHNPVIAKLKFRLKKPPTKSNKTPKIDIAKLSLLLTNLYQQLQRKRNNHG